MTLKQNTILKGLVAVLAIACAAVGYTIYQNKATSPENFTDHNIGSLSQRFEKQFKSQQDKSFRMFDSFFAANHDPFDEMQRLHKQMDQMMGNTLKDPFDHSWNSWFGDRFLGNSSGTDMPMTEKDKSYVITLPKLHA